MPDPAGTHVTNSDIAINEEPDVTITNSLTEGETRGLLQDRVVVLTGAGSGIGAESAKLFGRLSSPERS